MQGNSGSADRVLMPENGCIPGNSHRRGKILMPENGGMPGQEAGNSGSGGNSRRTRTEFTEVEREDMRQKLLANCIEAETGYVDANCKFNPQQLAVLSETYGISRKRANKFASNITDKYTVEQRPLLLRAGRQLTQVY